MNTQPLFKNFVRELRVNYGVVSYTNCNKVSSSLDACSILRDIWDSDISHREAFYILCLNRANKVIGYALISLGGISGTVADPKVIFSTALLANASSIILAHNHPSGNTEPSAADQALTKKMIQAGSVLDIQVLDHLIITPDTYLSFADENLMS
ncbi:MAG: JAB domain-containing protein [Lentimicrobiaceae bacterium]|nr:JAB domain-containing protein [Lentimicrobiaceae bacterium]